MIFYHTGTGNSLYVAKKLSENLTSIPLEEIIAANSQH
jgi:flavodoxin